MKSALFTLLISVALFSVAEPKSKYLSLKPSKALVLSQGQTEVLVIQGTVAPGHHIQANPASSPNLIPTEVKIESKRGVEVGKPQYPQGKPYRLKNSDKDMMAIEGSFEIKVPVTAALAKGGSYELLGSLRFQACNDTTCFFPEKLSLKIPVQVKK